MGKKERVILIKGGASQWYEQAIFIVKQSTAPENIPVDFVAEAEKIINNHVHKKYDKNSRYNVGIAYADSPAPGALYRASKKNAKRKSGHYDFILNTVMGIGCIIIAAVLILGIFA